MEEPEHHQQQALLSQERVEGFKTGQGIQLEQFFFNWSLVIINLTLIVAFVIVAALTMNEQFVRRFLHKRPQLVKNQKGLLAQMAVVQQKNMHIDLEGLLGGRGMRPSRLATLTQSLNPNEEKRRVVHKTNSQVLINDFKSRNKFPAKPQNLIRKSETLLKQTRLQDTRYQNVSTEPQQDLLNDFEQQSEGASVNTSLLSDREQLLHQYQVRHNQHDTYFEKVYQAYTHDHGGFYEESLLQKQALSPLDINEGRSAEIEPLIDKNEETQSILANKFAQQNSILVEESEGEDKRNQKYFGTRHNLMSLLSHTKSLMSGIQNRGSPTFMSKDEDLQNLIQNSMMSKEGSNFRQGIPSRHQSRQIEGFRNGYGKSQFAAGEDSSPGVSFLSKSQVSNNIP